MTAKQTLLDTIPAISEEVADELLDYLNLLIDPSEASLEDLEAVREGREAFERGECIDLDALRNQLAE